MKAFYMILLVMACAFSHVLAQQSPPGGRWPVPDVPGLLFYIQRDLDVNTVVYTLNTDDKGRVDPKNPVKVFWVRYTEGGVHKPLNLLQKDLAYGISAKPAGTDRYDLKAIAYPKMPMRLEKIRGNQYRVRVTLTGRECALKRIFVHIVGGSHLHPDIAYLEFNGEELATGQKVTEKITPN